MAEVKIGIKSIFGKVLFEYTKEDNTIRDTLIEAVKRDAYLRGADLCDAYLRGADLGGADLRGADLGGADLGGAYLRGADLRGADLGDAYLCDADLGGADLGGADLGGAYLGGADLRGADLGGAYLRGAGKLSKPDDILIVGNIGSRLGYTTIYNTDNGIYVRCGCFFGNIDEFVKKVEETHKGTQHERDYKALIDFAKVKFSKYEQ